MWLVTVSFIWILHVAGALVVTRGSFEKPEDTCSSILKTAVNTDRFPGVIAHGIHSITVEDLRLFKSDVSTENGVPTVNMDLTSDVPILQNAPNGDISPFKTPGLRAVDYVLQHMSNANFGIKQYTPLERLVHALHMQEIWNEALAPYKALEANPPSKQLCSCIKKVEENGIMDMLRYIALKIKAGEYFVTGTLMIEKGNSQHNGMESKQKEAAVHIINEDKWNTWKADMMQMLPSDNTDLALYLYCALNS